MVIIIIINRISKTNIEIKMIMRQLYGPYLTQPYKLKTKNLKRSGEAGFPTECVGRCGHS